MKIPNPSASDERGAIKDLIVKGLAHKAQTDDPALEAIDPQTIQNWMEPGAEVALKNYERHLATSEISDAIITRLGERLKQRTWLAALSELILSYSGALMALGLGVFLSSDHLSSNFIVNRIILYAILVVCLFQIAAAAILKYVIKPRD